MTFVKKFSSAAALVGCLAFMAGCPQKGEFRKLGAEDDVKNTAAHDHGHDHDVGPNGGHILELGQHHGEITVGADRTITVYILDGAAKNPQPVENATVTVKTKVNGEDRELKLEPQPLTGESETKVSSFKIAGNQVHESITNLEALVGEVTLKIGDQSSVAKLEHDHDHDHGHDDDHAHE